jgi:hypothetical protein
MGKGSERQLSKRELAASIGCVYCGKALTVDTVRLDHVIPRCLFPSSSGVTLMELPSCDDCNNDKSKYDSFLRDMAVMAKGSIDHPVARELHATVKRSIKKNKSEAFKQLVNSEIFALIVEERQVGPYRVVNEVMRGTVNFDSEYVRTALLWVIRGIYFACSTQRFPVDAKVKITHVPREKIAGLKSVLTDEQGNPWKEGVLGETCKFSIMFSPEHTNILLCFFDNIGFFVDAECSGLAAMQHARMMLNWMAYTGGKVRERGPTDGEAN